MGSPAQRWWCWLVRVAKYSVVVVINYYSPVTELHFYIDAYRGEVMNGGFGLLLDGSEEAAKRARLMLNWDVSNGVGM